MANSKITAASRKAKHGQKMIEIRLRFWTDEIASEGKIVQKHAWTSGVAGIQRNDAHGIIPGSPKPFNSLLEIGTAVEKVLIEHKIVLRPGRKDKKYLKDL